MVDFYIGGMTNVASESLRSLLERKAFSSMDEILQVSAFKMYTLCLNLRRNKRTHCMFLKKKGLSNPNNYFVQEMNIPINQSVLYLL